MPDPHRRRPSWEPTVDLKRKQPRFSPVFDAHDVAALVDHFDPHDEADYHRHYELLLHRYRSTVGLPSLMIWRVAPRAIAPVMLIGVLLTLPVTIEYFVNVVTSDSSDLLPAILVLMQATLLAGGTALVVTEGGWEVRFYYNIVRAMRAARNGQVRNYEIVNCINLGGKAARSLFSLVQITRRTWSSPPTVADMALEIAYPLIDVKAFDVLNPRPSQHALHTYTSFLYYAAALVAVDRFDLIPSLRQYYADEHSLASRRTSDEVSERDALYLDPMRNQTRWTIAKDYLYPLAAWFSFSVSTVALVVSVVS